MITSQGNYVSGNRISGSGTTLLLFLLGLGIGTIFGPELISATKEGKSYLRKVIEK